MKMPYKRLALFITGLAGGGAERVMLALAKTFADRGIPVDLVVTNARGALVSEVPDNVRLVNLGASRIILSFAELVRYFRKERPCLMLSALPSTNCLAVWARALGNAPTKLVLSEHNTLSVNADVVKDFRRKVMPYLMSWSYPKADRVVAVSRGVAKDLAKTIGLSANNIYVVYNPVVSEDLILRSQTQPQHPWFVSKNFNLILGVGRLIPQKDFATLIISFSKLLKRRDARLVILGEGPERNKLELLIDELDLRDKVSMPGFVSNPASYMRHSDVFVLSSRWEGFGNVLVEAMACNTRVVSTDCPSGPAEILEDGRWGELVRVGAAAEMSEIIINTLDQPCPELTMRAADFSVDKAADQYLDLFESLLGSSMCWVE